MFVGNLVKPLGKKSTNILKQGVKKHILNLKTQHSPSKMEVFSCHFFLHGQPWVLVCSSYMIL